MPARVTGTPIAALLAVALALASCESAVKHPAITAGIVGGAIGFGSCEMDSVAAKTCAVIGGSTALFLGGVAALVTLLLDTGDHSVPVDEAPFEGLPPDEAAPPPTTNGAFMPPVVGHAPADAGVSAADAPLSP